MQDTFYNDQRNHSSIDYSKPIFDWLKNFKNEAAEKWEYIMSGELKKKQKQLLGDLDIFNLPSFKAVHMHRTRFADLRFRLGAGYLYCHQVHPSLPPPHPLLSLSLCVLDFLSFESKSHLLFTGKVIISPLSVNSCTYF